jgi:hypothetical protein
MGIFYCLVESWQVNGQHSIEGELHANQPEVSITSLASLSSKLLFGLEGNWHGLLCRKRFNSSTGLDKNFGIIK